MFDMRIPHIEDVPGSPIEQKSYDIAGGVDWRTKEEMERIRQANAGNAMRQRAMEGLPMMEGAATGRESAVRAATALAMSRANASAAAQGAQGSPLAARQAMARQAAMQTAVAGQAAPAIAAEQQKAQQAYIAAAQGQRAQDIRKQIGLEEIAQREMGMGLQTKWDAAKSQMEFEQEKIRKYGLDMGVWDAAAKMAQARQAATMGAIGSASSTALSYLSGLGGKETPPSYDYGDKSTWPTANNPNWSV